MSNTSFSTSEGGQSVLRDTPQKLLADSGPLTLTASGDTYSQNLWPKWCVANARNAMLIIDVTGLSGTTPSITFYADILMPDGQTWVNMHAFTAITAPTIADYLLGPAGNTIAMIGTDVRLRWASVAGTINAHLYLIAES